MSSSEQPRGTAAPPTMLSQNNAASFFEQMELRMDNNRATEEPNTDSQPETQNLRTVDQAVEHRNRIRARLRRIVGSNRRRQEEEVEDASQETERAHRYARSLGGIAAAHQQHEREELAQFDEDQTGSLGEMLRILTGDRDMSHSYRQRRRCGNGIYGGAGYSPTGSPIATPVNH